MIPARRHARYRKTAPGALSTCVTSRSPRRRPSCWSLRAKRPLACSNCAYVKRRPSSNSRKGRGRCGRNRRRNFAYRFSVMARASTRGGGQVVATNNASATVHPGLALHHEGYGGSVRVTSLGILGNQKKSPETDTMNGEVNHAARHLGELYFPQGFSSPALLPGLALQVPAPFGMPPGSCQRSWAGRSRGWRPPCRPR
jgi:hypothetical protein